MPDETPTNGIPKAFALSELGQTGLKRFSGYILEDYDPQISGQRWRTIAKEMLCDPVIAAMFFMLEMMIRGVKWDFTAADSDSNEEVKDFVKGAIFEDMNQGWPDLVAQILSFVPWGFSWFEVVFKERNGQQPSTPFMPENSTGASQGIDLPQEVASSKFNDGKIGFRKWAIRSQDTVLRWEFDENGGIRALVQLSPPKYRITTIPIEKSLLFRLSTQKNDPEGGRGMLRKMYRAWYFKTKLENLEGIGIERDTAGVPVLKMPGQAMTPNADGSENAIYAAAKKIVTGFKNDEQAGLVLDSTRDEHGNALWEFELVGAAGNKQFDVGKTIERWDQRMLMCMVSDLLKMGHERVGSFAMADVKKDVLQMAIGAFLDYISDVVNRHAVPKLLRINSIPEDLAPSLGHGDVEPLDLEQVGQFIKDTTGINVDMTSIFGYLMKRAQIPLGKDETDSPTLKTAKPQPANEQLPADKQAREVKRFADLPLETRLELRRMSAREALERQAAEDYPSIGSGLGRGVHRSESGVPDDADRKMMRRSWIQSSNGKAKKLYLK